MSSDPTGQDTISFLKRLQVACIFRPHYYTFSTLAHHATFSYHLAAGHQSRVQKTFCKEFLALLSRYPPQQTLPPPTNLVFSLLSNGLLPPSNGGPSLEQNVTFSGQNEDYLHTAFPFCNNYAAFLRLQSDMYVSQHPSKQKPDVSDRPVSSARFFHLQLLIHPLRSTFIP